MKRTTRHLISRWLMRSVLIACGLILLFALVCDRPPFIFGHAPFMVATSSMEPHYPAHSLVIIKKVDAHTLATGDVIAFKSDALGGGIAMHRISRIDESGIFTKGDGCLLEDNQALESADIVGKCVGGISGKSGAARLLRALSRPKGVLTLLIFPVIIAMLITAARRFAANPSKNKSG